MKIFFSRGSRITNKYNSTCKSRFTGKKAPFTLHEKSIGDPLYNKLDSHISCNQYQLQQLQCFHFVLLVLLFFFVVSQFNDIPLAHHIIFQTVQHKQGDQPKKRVSSNLVFICGPNDSQIAQHTANIGKSLFNFLIGVLTSCYMTMMMTTMAI